MPCSQRCSCLQRWNFNLLATSQPTATMNKIQHFWLVSKPKWGPICLQKRQFVLFINHYITYIKRSVLYLLCYCWRLGSCNTIKVWPPEVRATFRVHGPGLHLTRFRMGARVEGRADGLRGESRFAKSGGRFLSGIFWKKVSFWERTGQPWRSRKWSRLSLPFSVHCPLQCLARISLAEVK